MTRRAPALAAALALAALILTGCGGEDAPAKSASPSASPTSASPSPTTSATRTETATIEAAPGPTETVAAPEAAPPQNPAGDDEVQRFFQTGGQCISDVWSSSMPHTDALQQKVIDYCSAHQLGDWAGGADPIDPSHYGGGQSQTGESGYQKPDVDENGYVGPSKEYYGYSGYVAPGFEYQVGSECFDVTLGRCKTSGEIQTENLGK